MHIRLRSRGLRTTLAGSRCRAYDLVLINRPLKKKEKESIAHQLFRLPCGTPSPEFALTRRARKREKATAEKKEIKN